MKNTGLLLGILSFSLWGVLPIYLKQIPSYSAYEITAYRIILSFVLLVLIRALPQSFPKMISNLKRFISSPLMYICSLLIGLNWFLFVYAVESNQITQASFGYFCGPVINVTLAFFILKEKMTRLKLVAIGITAIGIIVQAVGLSDFPLLSIVLAFTFALYGLTKKIIKANSADALLFETLVLLIPCFYYLYFHAQTVLLDVELGENMFLLGSGIASVLPLYLFSRAAPQIPFMTLGFLQYIAPSLQFICGYFIYSEQMTQSKIISFCLIWLACIILTLSTQIKGKVK